MSSRDIHRALQVLEKGDAFGDRDSGFGKVLAKSNPVEWTQAVCVTAWEMVQRHETALRARGVNPRLIRNPYEKPKDVKTVVNRRPTSKPASAFTATISRDESRIILACENYPGERAVRTVRQMRGSVLRRRPKYHWVVPVAAAAQILRARAEQLVVADDKVARFLHRAVKDQQAAVELSSQADAELRVPGLGGELMPFQRAGVAYAMKAGRTFIADDMGLGKTVQAIATLKARDAFPAVVVCPSSLKLNWDREIRKWIPSLRRVYVAGGKEANPIPAGTAVVVINYDVLWWWASVLGPWCKAVVFDESQYLKSGKAKRTKAAQQIAKAKQTVLLLSGTPVVNRPVDLISQLKTMDRLQDLGGYSTFTKRYCIRSRFGFTAGGRNLEELNAKLRQTCFVRRLKSQVLTGLPPKHRVEVPFKLQGRGLRDYSKAQEQAKDLLAKARDERTMARAMGRDPEGWAVAAAMTAVGDLRRAATMAKLPDVEEWIRARVDEGNKLVVFGHHLAVVKGLAEKFRAPAIIGETAMEDRQAIVDHFQTDPAARLVFLNIKAGGVGLTLTASSNVVFVESGWTPADNDQAEDRCYRIGQEDSRVTAWYLNAVDTIDEWMMKLIQKKRTVVDAATEGDAASQQSIMTELAGMIEG